MKRSNSVPDFTKYAEQNFTGEIVQSPRFYSPRNEFNRSESQLADLLHIFAPEIRRGAIKFNSRDQRFWIYNKMNIIHERMPNLDPSTVSELIKSLEVVIDLERTEMYERVGQFNVGIDDSYITINCNPNMRENVLRVIHTREFKKFCIAYSKTDNFDKRVKNYFRYTLLEDDI